MASPEQFCSLKMLKMEKVRRGKRGRRRSKSLIFRFSKVVPKPPNLENRADSEKENESPLPSTAADGASNAFIKEEPMDDAERCSNASTSDGLNATGSESGAGEVKSEPVRHEGRPEESSSFPETSFIRKSKFTEGRRSSQRILLRFQRDSFSDPPDSHPVHEASTRGRKLNGSSRGTRGRRGGRRPTISFQEPQVLVAPDRLQRQYGRRGRPPKSSLSLKLMSCSLTSNPDVSGLETETAPQEVLPDSELKNSVWTLVPRDLFNMDFFKSKVMKVRFCSPRQKTPDFPSHMPPYSAQNSVGAGFSPRVQRPPFGPRAPTPRRLPYVQGRPADANVATRRPTVIYFNSQKPDQEGQERLELPPYRTAYKKYINDSRSGLSYVLTKYPKVDSHQALRKRYDECGRNLNAGESRLIHDVREEALAMLSTNQIANDLYASSPNYNTTLEPVLYSPSDSSSLDQETSNKGQIASEIKVEDTLCREVIVESLKILWDEESVL